MLVDTAETFSGVPWKDMNITIFLLPLIQQLYLSDKNCGMKWMNGTIGFDDILFHIVISCTLRARRNQEKKEIMFQIGECSGFRWLRTFLIVASFLLVKRWCYIAYSLPRLMFFKKNPIRTRSYRDLRDWTKKLFSYLIVV